MWTRFARMSKEDYSLGASWEESGHRGIAEMFVQRDVDGNVPGSIESWLDKPEQAE